MVGQSNTPEVDLGSQILLIPTFVSLIPIRQTIDRSDNTEAVLFGQSVCIEEVCWLANLYTLTMDDSTPGSTNNSHSMDQITKGYLSNNFFLLQ